MTDTETPQGKPGAAPPPAGRFFRPGPASPDVRGPGPAGDREADAFHRDRRRHDPSAAGTHRPRRSPGTRTGT
ncbi:hypothetical protein ACIQJT_34560 [Streptomyces sp. NPDC091972]|uniref:hypothetical protein n=1 Tax=Streptomyces sp. NPDC091972 TaxID=3366007 RepID=UPI003825ADED